MLSKVGGTPLLVDEIIKVVSVGVARVKEVDRLIKDALERDAKKGGRSDLLVASHDM